MHKHVARRGELLEQVDAACVAGAGRVGIGRLAEWRGRAWAIVGSVIGVAVLSLLECITARGTCLIGDGPSSPAQTGLGKRWAHRLLGCGPSSLAQSHTPPLQRWVGERGKYWSRLGGLIRKRLSVVETGVEFEWRRSRRLCRPARLTPAKGPALSVSGCTAHVANRK